MTSGKRGRPKGVPNKQSKEQVASAKRGGMMPLGAMLKGMRYWLRVFDLEEAKDPEAVGADGFPDVVKRPDMTRMEYALDRMREFAVQAAPYVHARLSAQAHFSGESAEQMEAFRGAREKLAALLTAVEQGTPLTLVPLVPVKVIEHQAGEGETLTEQEAAMIAGAGDADSK